ncbi:MAG: MG2 domain-containing protein [Candidatus Bathyarchaeia archaeon]
MATRKDIAFVMIGFFLASLIPGIASSQVATVTTDKPLYSPGDNVTVSGVAAADKLVAITVSRPDGVIILLVAAPADSQGKFSRTFKLPSDAIEGKYTYSASEGGTTKTTTFQVAGQITVTTDKVSYPPGEVVSISGTASSFTGVTVEVLNPVESMIFSTASTADSEGRYSASFQLLDDAILGIYTVTVKSAFGATATATFSVVAHAVFPVTILGVELMDSIGNPKLDFSAGETVLFSTGVQNSDVDSKSLLVSLQVLDPEFAVLFPKFIILTLESGQEFTFSPNVVLPTDAIDGTWTVESVVFSDFPSKGGVPLAQPIEVTFEVKS